MHQWKERGEKSGASSQESALDFLSLLESTDPNIIESVQNMIHENLYNTKDSRFLGVLVEYHLAVKSKRSLDILLQIKDPHDKHLFDKISELMKTDSYLAEALRLFSNIVYCHPTWLHKIASHRIMHNLLHMLKTNTNPMHLMSGIFILVSLLPVIPSKFGPFLSETFEIFSRLTALTVKETSSLLNVYVMHLQIGIYSLFHRLYGMFPCNFLAHLRSHYGGSNCSEINIRAFSLVIKPMLEQVKLHPLLVTASKDTELSASRWKKMNYHDIIVDCASISLDAIEGSEEILQPKHLPAQIQNDQNLSSIDSSQFQSFSSQSSASVSAEGTSLVSDALCLQSTMWSPSQAISVATTPPPGASSAPQLSFKGDWCAKSYSMQSSIDESTALDFAVEAKPELSVDNSLEHVNQETILKEHELDVLVESISAQQSKEIRSETVQLSLSNNMPKKLTSSETKQDEADKEVSELTSSQSATSKSNSPCAREYTPFCFTTRNLTGEPPSLTTAMSTSDSTKSGSLTKSSEECNDEMYSSLQDPDADAFVPSFNHCSFVGPCGQSSKCTQKPKMIRSQSCPAKLFPTSASSGAPCRIHTCERSVTCCSSVVATNSAFVPVLSQNVSARPERILAYKDLVPLMQTSTSAALRRNDNSCLRSLSPPELLDRYIQLGSLTYLNQLGIPITSSKSTNWTHFGGSPPLDEVMILRNQIKLLHCQLMFERHRKNVHSERNRSILGRSKRSKMQEDHIASLDKRVFLLEQDNEKLQTEVTIHSKLYEKLKNNTIKTESELKSKIKKYEYDNTQLRISNEKLQTVLVSQKEENDEIREGCKKSHSEMENLRLQLELFSKELLRCHKVEKDAVFLSKQVVLLQELITNYRDKVEQMKQTQGSDIGEDLMNRAALLEINELKSKLESQNYVNDSTKSKINELEQKVTSLKQNQKEQLKAFEDLKTFQADEIKVREERLQDLRKVSIQKDSHILELNMKIESLAESIRKLEKKSNSVDSDTSAGAQSSS